MNEFNKIFFSTLSKEYCIYFYALSVIALLSLLLTVGCIIYKMITKKKKCSVNFELYNIFMLGIIYFQNRLLYSMCIN